MATLSGSHAVKSLNKGPGKRRFVFKTFSQRLDDVEIDVFHSLDAIKSAPSEGSSFFRESLVQWRELNTAKNFISFYDIIMPKARTLPLVILHKEFIVSELLSRLTMDARLSLEPLLRLLPALSRDILVDFIPFLPLIVKSFFCIFESGADREPEIIEQIFASWSHMMMYLQKYLVENILSILKVTAALRYYSKEYIQEFMAEAMSFLMRNAPVEQLAEGIQEILCEVIEKPSAVTKFGASVLFMHSMRGTSLKFHSKAMPILRILLDQSTFDICDKTSEGSEILGDVLVATFQKLCKEFPAEELNILWICLRERIGNLLDDSCSSYFSCLLSVLVATVRSDKDHRIFDHKKLLVLVDLLLETFFVSPGVGSSDNTCKIFDKVLQLMLCVLYGIRRSNEVDTLDYVASHWANIFQLRSKSLQAFIEELLQGEASLLYAFRFNILSVLKGVIETSQQGAVYLILRFGQKLEIQSFESFVGVSDAFVSEICHFMHNAMRDWIGIIDVNIHGNSSIEPFNEERLALLWGIVQCYRYMPASDANKVLLVDCINALDRLLMGNAEIIAGVSRSLWQGLLGAAISSYGKLCNRAGSTFDEASKFLHLARTNRLSWHVLHAVADFFDSWKSIVVPDQLQVKGVESCYLSDLVPEKIMGTMHELGGNLCHVNKNVRISTLRMLIHYERLGGKHFVTYSSQRKEETGVSADVDTGRPCCNVLELLYQVETTPLSIFTDQKVTGLISQIQTRLTDRGTSKAYLSIILNAIIGILYNKFTPIWSSATECLSILLRNYVTDVWDGFMHFIENCQLIFLSSEVQCSDQDTNPAREISSLLTLFNQSVYSRKDSTQTATILSTLLKSLQKIPSMDESRCHHVLGLFLKFLGYGDKLSSLGSFKLSCCRKKEWILVLKEWLGLLKLMNVESSYCSHFLKGVLKHRLLGENDAETQMKVLDCLLMWKDDFLLSYVQHLRYLINPESIREELATWNLSKDSSFISECHRPQIVPLIILILMPQIRKLKKIGTRKISSIHCRRAMLRLIAQLDVSELSLFFALLVKPLHVVSGELNEEDSFFSDCSNNYNLLSLLKYFGPGNFSALTWKKISGILHVFNDVLAIFDEFHVKPFLNFLISCIVRVLRNCNIFIESGYCNEYCPTGRESVAMVDKASKTHAQVTGKQLKEVRSMCLKLISFVVNKYDNHTFSNDFLDLFFLSVKPLVQHLKQEGTGSEMPSSLLRCFIAMTRNYDLVSLLLKDTSIADAIFSILSSATSEAVICCVLTFIQNLLTADDELGLDDPAIERILASNMECLVSNLHRILMNYIIQRKIIRRSGGIVLKLLRLLAKRVGDQLANRFVVALLPLLRIKSVDPCFFLEVSHIIGSITPLLNSKVKAKVLTTVSPFLIVAGMDVRDSICCLLDNFSQSDPDISSLAKLIHELNATSTLEVGELDYDVILSAYDHVNAEFFSCVRSDLAKILLSHFIYHLSSTDLTLRQSAFRSLLSFIEFCTKITACESTSPEMPNAFTSGISGWTEASISSIINVFLLKHMADAMRRGVVCKEWIELLREMVLNLPENVGLSSYKALCSRDVDEDFFHNIIHLQDRRRVKALARFRSSISNGTFPQAMTSKLFVPLFFKMLFDVHGGKEHIRYACIETLASISCYINWNLYSSLLDRCFHEMTLKPEQKKLLLRLACSILDQFHFFDAGCSKITDDPLCHTSGCDIGSMVSMSSPTKRDPISFSSIQKCLQETFYPMLQKLLNDESDNVNPNARLATIKLLKLLPHDIMELQLSTMIHRICKFLKSRKESVRDEARSVLGSCLKELGMDYFVFVLSVLRSALRRGYELHVLGYTLNFILSTVENKIQGQLDNCLDDLLSIIQNDIFGHVAEEKDVEKIASKMKETRKKKSFDSLKLISQSITFKSHALRLLSPVISMLDMHLRPSMKAKLETMLHHINRGIENNQSVVQVDLFVFIYDMIVGRLYNQINAVQDNSVSVINAKHRGGVSSKCFPGGSEIVNHVSVESSHLITAFGLRLLQNNLKKINFGNCDTEILGLLEPFVKVLCSFLRSSYEDIISSSLRCLALLSQFPFPAFKAESHNMKIAVLDIFQGSSSADTPLVHGCLKVLITLLGGLKVTLSSDQLCILIQSPLFVDLENNNSPLVLSLLKAVISRRLVIPEIYDLVERIAELMVKSQIESVRKKCSKILLKFLLDYQISQKRLQQHINFLLVNLKFEHSAGREAVLEMLHAIIIKFPRTIVEDQSQAFFLQFVMCLANDHDSNIRSMTGAALKNLFKRMSVQSIHSVLEFSISWYLGANVRLWSAAAQVLGLLVEVAAKGIQKRLHCILPGLKTVLSSAKNDMRDSKLSSGDDVTVPPSWKEAYYSLVMLEKMLNKFGDLIFDKDLEEIWELITEILLHSHTWLRNISGRLVAFYFWKSREVVKGGCENVPGTYSLLRPSRIFRLAACFCCQLKKSIDANAAEVLRENLGFSVWAVHLLMGQEKNLSARVFWSSLDLHDRGCFLNAFQLLSAGKIYNTFMSFSYGVCISSNDDDIEDVHVYLVSYLLKRIGKIALTTDIVQMKIVFCVLKAVATKLGEESCHQYAEELLHPVYRVCEGYSGRVVPDDAKQLAQEARDAIRDIIGIQKFVHVYSGIRKNLKAKRDKRRQQEKVLAAANPVLNAKRKLSIAAKRRASKKRKLMAAKAMRRRAR